MGGYGFLRFSLPMFASASEMFAPLIFVLSIMAIIYTSLVALAQEDMKKLIAYSSVAHMGFVTMGIFTLTQQGIDGGIFQMLSHGVVSGALFLCVGVVYDRMHTREISAYGGLVNRMPIYAACFMVFTLANVGLPGTGGFIGEFLTMLGAFRVNTWVAILAATGVILSACYMLYLYWRVIFGELVKPALATIKDLSLREVAILTPLVVVTIVMGVYPKSVFDVTSPRWPTDPAAQRPRWRMTARRIRRVRLAKETCHDHRTRPPRSAAGVDPGDRRMAALMIGAMRGNKATGLLSLVMVVLMFAAGCIVVAAPDARAFHGASWRTASRASPRS